MRLGLKVVLALDDENTSASTDGLLCMLLSSDVRRALPDVGDTGGDGVRMNRSVRSSTSSEKPRGLLRLRSVRGVSVRTKPCVDL